MVLFALPMPAVVLDASNRFTFANGAAEQFFKLSAPPAYPFGSGAKSVVAAS